MSNYDSDPRERTSYLGCFVLMWLGISVVMMVAAISNTLDGDYSKAAFAAAASALVFLGSMKIAESMSSTGG